MLLSHQVRFLEKITRKYKEIFVGKADISSTLITRSDGSTISLEEIADNIVPLNAITDEEAQADFDAIVGP